jgi:hypothetical protein
MSIFIYIYIYIVISVEEILQAVHAVLGGVAVHPAADLLLKNLPARVEQIFQLSTISWEPSRVLIRARATAIDQFREIPLDQFNLDHLWPPLPAATTRQTEDLLAVVRTGSECEEKSRGGGQQEYSGDHVEVAKCHKEIRLDQLFLPVSSPRRSAQRLLPGSDLEQFLAHFSILLSKHIHR